MNWIRLALSSLSLLLLCTQLAAFAAPENGQPEAAAQASAAGLPFEPDILMVSVARGADKNEVAQKLKDLNATVRETIDSPIGQILVLNTAKGKLSETENRIRQDKAHFPLVQKSYIGSLRIDDSSFSVDTSVLDDASVSGPLGRPSPERRFPNDPLLPGQWQLAAVRAPQVLRDFPLYTPSLDDPILVIMDTGCSPTRSGDAGVKIDAGLDASLPPGLPPAFPAGPDVDGHGSLVFNAAAAQTNNRLFGASLHKGRVYPIRVLRGGLSDFNLIRALTRVSDLVTRGERCVVNMSFGWPAPFDLSREFLHPLPNALMRRLYDGGHVMFFQAAENMSRRDPTARLPYLNVVAGTAAGDSRYVSSGMGPSVSFAAPAQAVQLFQDGRTMVVSGNSFSSPLVASIACRIWSANPVLTGPQIRDVLLRSSRRLPLLTAEQQGNGMPDARRAMEIVTGR